MSEATAGEGESETVPERVAELERENEELRRQNTILEQRIDAVLTRLDRVEEYIVGDSGAISQSYLRNKRPIEEQIEEEQKTRSQHDARIERRVGMIADETDVDLSDTTVAGEDKIQRLIRNGPGDVVDKIYPVHERARMVLMHAGEWGTASEDANGKRITFRSPTVRERLELKRDESLQSKQVRDVFEKIVEFAADSPRRAVARKTDDGVNQLVIHLGDE